MMRLLIPFLLLLLVVAAVLLVRRWMGSRGPMKGGILPYRKKEHLLSAAERSFFEVLSEAVGHQYYVFVKVRLADLIYLPQATENRQAHLDRLASQHVDFVLCEPTELKPLMVVELDRPSAENDERRERNAFVDAALAAAGLVVLHLPVQRTYPPTELAELVGKKLAGRTE